MKNILIFLVLTTISFSPSSAQKSEKFNVFIWRFFNYPEFQIERVIFPIERFRLIDEPMSLSPSVKKELFIRQDWMHLKGPKNFQCERNCYDIRIYDNYEKKLNDSGKRVLSLEGVENGINNSYYFKLIENKWHLVKIEWLST